MRILIEIPQVIFDKLKYPISGVHYLREDPRKNWNKKENIEALKLNIISILERYVDENLQHR